MEIDQLTFFEIILAIMGVVVIPILYLVWRSATQITTIKVEIEHLTDKFDREVESSEKLHARMERKIDDLCERLAKAEAKLEQ